MTATPAPSHLATLLANTARAGVRPLPPGSAAALCAAAADNGFVCRRLDLADCAGKSDLLRRFATALDFPDWFGQNWDALDDCLGDLSWLPAAGYVLVLEHAAGLHTGHRADFDTALDMLRSAATGWRDQGVPFWVFVDLAGNPAPGAA